MEPDDLSALVGALATDQAAFEQIVVRFGRLVWAVTWGYGLDHHTRCDVVQYTWLQLHQHASTIRDPQRLGGWLATTARREAARLARRGHRTTPVDPHDVDLAVEPALDDRLIRDEDVRAVATAVSALSARCQRLFRMLSVDPPASYDDVADALGIAIGSVGPTRLRCFEKLGRELARLGIVVRRRAHA